MRWPYNPLQATPGIVESIPHGWNLSYFGDDIQSPAAICNPCCDPEKKTNPRLN